MPTIIDSTYFTGEINVPKKSDVGDFERLNYFIAKKEEEFLHDLFGYEFAKAFTEGIAVEPTPDAMWSDLLNGAEYTDLSGSLRKWRGLKFTTSTGGYKLSPIANYVYFEWWTDAVTITTPMGEVKGKTETAREEIPTFKMVRAWNEMIDWLYELDLFLQARRTTYDLFWTTYTRYPWKFRKVNALNI